MRLQTQLIQLPLVMKMEKERHKNLLPTIDRLLQTRRQRMDQEKEMRMELVVGFFVYFFVII